MRVLNTTNDVQLMAASRTVPGGDGDFDDNTSPQKGNTDGAVTIINKVL